MSKNKMLIIIVGVVIIIIAVLSVIFIMKESDTATIQVVEVQEGLDDNATSTPITNTNTNVGSGNQAAMTYQQALVRYQDLRLQINDCVMLPSSVTYKNSTSVLIDNRGTQAVQVYFDKQVVKLSAYQFKIITLKSSLMPHQITVRCQTGGVDHFNIGQILLQK